MKNRNLLILALFTLLTSCISIMVWHFGVLQERLLISAKLESAELLSNVQREVRSLYTQDVATPITEAGLPLTHDSAQGFLLPIKFSTRLGDRIAQQTPHAASLYSPYPFPWTAAERPPLDPFQVEAWEELTRDLEKPFYRFEARHGDRILRYAVADRMRPACVHCHNTYPGTPKTDWQDGDLRGVLEVQVSSTSLIEKTRDDLRQTVWIFVTLSVLGTLAFVLVMGWLWRESAMLEELVRQRTAALESEIEERRRAERFKDEMISTVSHELRTPLTSIRGTVGLLAGKALGELPARAAELLGIALKNIDRLGLLIDDLLDVAKIQSGRLRIDRRRLEIVHLVDQAVEDLRGYGQRCQVKIVRHPEPALGITVHADRERLLQVLGNLVSNAIKHSSPGGSVEVGAEMRGEKVRLRVRDHGPGIPEDMRERIFDRFVQVDGASTRLHGGSGLGLAIAKSLVEAHDGTIGVEAAEGGGSVFWFELEASQDLSTAPH